MKVFVLEEGYADMPGISKVFASRDAFDRYVDAYEPSDYERMSDTEECFEFIKNGDPVTFYLTEMEVDE